MESGESINSKIQWVIYTARGFRSTRHFVTVSKAIASLVRLGLEGQESRKREFFGKLKTNLANDDPGRQDRLIDEFRALILGPLNAKTRWDRLVRGRRGPTFAIERGKGFGTFKLCGNGRLPGTFLLATHAAHGMRRWLRFGLSRHHAGQLRKGAWRLRRYRWPK